MSSTDFRDDFYDRLREYMQAYDGIGGGLQMAERIADIAEEGFKVHCQVAQMMDGKRVEYAVTDADDLALATAVAAIDSAGVAGAAYLRGYMAQQNTLGRVVDARHAACAWHAFYESALHLVLRPGEAFPAGIGDPDEQLPAEVTT
jgi:hypothetical protein